ncbi:MAG: FUSC family protein [Cyanobium sp.]
MNAPGRLGLRLVLAVAGACGLTWSLCHGLQLGAATPYGVVVAALLIRPDFGRQPPALLALLPVVVLLGLSLGTLLRPLLEGPQVWQFAIVTAIAQILGQALPDKLMLLRNLLAVLAVLPLLAGNATWLGAWQQTLAVLLGLLTATLIQASLRLPGDGAAADADGDPDAHAAAPERDSPAERGDPEASATDAAQPNQPPESKLAAAAAEGIAPARSLAMRFQDPFFWRKLVVAMLALSIGVGVGATNPKYLYFGVVLLLGDNLGATLARVRDRMIGVSLGVLMPWLVFNNFPIDALSVALVMGGTTALVLLFRLMPHLRTALISSAITFVGYGALTDWYVPSRWIDYLMGCGLALLVCLLVRPVSALRRFRRLATEQLAAAAMAAEPSERRTAELQALLPSALEEARLLGQERNLQDLLQRLQGETAIPKR